MENLENKQTTETTEVNTEQEQEVSQEIEKETKTFTEEDLNKKIQSAEDRVRTEYSKKIKDMENKIKELAPVQKSQSELDMEQRIKALEQKEKEVQAKERLLNINNKLVEKGLPQGLTKFLNVEGLEDVETSLNELKEIFNNTALNNSFKPKNHSNAKEVVSKEQFNKMSYMERQKLYETNQELYKKLSK
ncbi:capsid assembly scaffolding protein Gp46 family protein [Clostridium sporogenes]|uniref:capsid assembly scaffolding protein Gp46 family protein n=1 Tax=Clostridium sporogenes TaxID=1509 RepID=UPI0013D41FDE|nr:DUF4355 domain-containing protein [Clostridium sporogenes]NFR24920.1 hypothetical protein [Clostridium sporogenes]